MDEKLDRLKSYEQKIRDLQMRLAGVENKRIGSAVCIAAFSVLFAVHILGGLPPRNDFLGALIFVITFACMMIYHSANKDKAAIEHSIEVNQKALRSLTSRL